MAFLPYAEALKQTTDYEKGARAVDSCSHATPEQSFDPGASALLTSLTPDAFDKRSKIFLHPLMGMSALTTIWVAA